MEKLKDGNMLSKVNTTRSVLHILEFLLHSNLIGISLHALLRMEAMCVSSSSRLRYFGTKSKLEKMWYSTECNTPSCICAKFREN